MALPAWHFHTHSTTNGCCSPNSSNDQNSGPALPLSACRVVGDQERPYVYVTIHDSQFVNLAGSYNSSHRFLRAAKLPQAGYTV